MRVPTARECSVSDRDFALEFIASVAVCGLVAAVVAGYKTASVATVIAVALVLLVVGVLLFLHVRKEDSSMSSGDAVFLAGFVLVYALGAAGILWLAYCACWE